MSSPPPKVRSQSAPSEKGCGRGYARMAQPGQAMLIVKGIGNVHGPVKHYFVAQAGAGVDPGNAGTPPGAIIQYGGFDTADLGRIGYFICQGCGAKRKG